MAIKHKFISAFCKLTTIVIFISFIFCLTEQLSASTDKTAPPPESTALKIQDLVMDMADAYIASLGESVYLLTRSGNLDAKGRWLAQSFLRNGVGASLDIAVGPNPAVNLLDLMVLTSLQTWSFEAHWIPSGIGETGISALEHLKNAEADAWAVARENLSEEQLNSVRGLIDAWIAENSDRTVVSLVRFKEFADERRMSSLTMRGKAHGLLKEVSKATAVVDDTRLLGERLLWLANRYPYLLGEQTELTAYRLMDQPEGLEFMEAITSARRLSNVLAERIGTIQNDLEKQQLTFFSKLSAERVAAITQWQDALETTLKKSLDGATKDATILRSETIDQFFNRLSQERTLLLDDIGTRQNQFTGMMKELNETITVSGTLAKELTDTVNAIDQVMGRFDVDPEEKREPLRMTDVRDAAIETGRAAERLTLLLEQTVQLLESETWDRRISSLVDPANTVFDKVFWRGVILICILIVGLGLLKLVPQHVKEIDRKRRS